METVDLAQVPVIILAGGNGYLDPEHDYNPVPKPLVSVLGAPIILHTINHYRKAGFKDFFIAAGSGRKYFDIFKEQLASGHYTNVNDPFTGSQYPKFESRDCRLEIFDTGENNGTGSRISQVVKKLKLTSPFCVSYGDTISNVSIESLISFHFEQKKLVTLVATHSPTRFRILGLLDQDPIIRGVSNKPVLNKDFINGGYYVFQPEVFNTTDLEESPTCVLENEVLEGLIKKRQVAAFRHAGFWWFIDSERDRKLIVKELEPYSTKN